MWTVLRRAVVAHVQTWRPYTLCYPALVGVAGASLAGADRAGEFAAAAAAPALGWLAGHYLGDYFDRELDAIAKPQRPIPSGRLSATAALVGGICCALGSALVVVAANWRALALFALAMTGIVAYSRVYKGRGLVGNVVRGLITVLAFLVGAMTADPLPTWPVLALTPLFLLHDTASNLVGAIRDVAGDRAGGYRSVPARHGVPYSVRLALVLYSAAIAVALIGALLLLHDRAACLVLLGCAAAIGVAAIVPLFAMTPAATRARALRAHELLVIERLVLAASVIVTGVGVLTAVLVLLPVLLFSGSTQALMRSRHELPPTGLETHGMVGQI
ncbi:UbiA family prenyltransferase [Nocardia sp. NEAU-G5]|uniref:UbiA family prenyltransferase n=1 Tax=Nocardia albiluteola TaxID=2842303 RepID=A0ABS6B3A8_9NOCA|nr:UbiA family prenyltransferase [Nocardia albiluteola]MBU3064782.1 UbiA family prenyltransferase [Nocardia albiluteola]